MVDRTAKERMKRYRNRKREGACVEHVVISPEFISKYLINSTGEKVPLQDFVDRIIGEDMDPVEKMMQRVTRQLKLMK